MADVVVVGSYNAGLTIYGRRLPEPGETVVGDRFERGPGGKGANQAVGAQRLGADVFFVTKIGADVFGEEARTALFAEGLPSSGILTGVGTTGIAMIVVDAQGENAISIAPGTNLELLSEEVLGSFRAELDECRFLLLQLECSAELALDLAAWAWSKGKRTILNPAPARELPIQALMFFDIMTPNEDEVLSLGKIMGLGGETVEVVAQGFVGYGVHDVVVTLGERGALWASVAGVRHFDAYKVDAVDTTGAGDAFNAGLVAALARGASMEAAIDEGCLAGAFCVARPGVFDGLATRTELESLRRSLTPRAAKQAGAAYG